MLQQIALRARQRLSSVIKHLPYGGSSAPHIVFLASLLLSFVALLNNSVINRDGILYVETARIFLRDGLRASFGAFSWPFLSIAIAAISKVTGLEIETAGHVLNALFMAGTCSLIVATAQRRIPEATRYVALAVLALPAINQYRDELLREYGCWFFVLLSFWHATNWVGRPGWTDAVLVQLALGFAALFRPEALVFLLVFPLWQLFSGTNDDRWRRTFMFGCLPLLGSIVLLAAYFSGMLSSGDRLYGELSRVSVARFDAKAQALSAALIPYAQDGARAILFMGSIALVPLKFLRQLGLFVIPLLYLFKTAGFRSALARLPVFAWAFLIDLIVLSVFAVDMQFLAGRYVAVLSLLASPHIGLGCWQLTQRYPKSKYVVLLLCGLLMVSNVVSWRPGQNQFREAGDWLAAHVTESSVVYVEGTRTLYYAGWNPATAHLPEERSLLASADQREKFDLYVFEVAREDEGIDAWLLHNDFREIARFKSMRNGSVLIAVRNARQSDISKGMK